MRKPVQKLPNTGGATGDNSISASDETAVEVLPIALGTSRTTRYTKAAAQRGGKTQTSVRDHATGISAYIDS